MRKLLPGLVLAVSVITAGIAIIGVLSAPPKVNKIELQVIGSSENWKENISQYVFSLITPGEELDSEKLNFLVKEINKLPWVSKCNVSTFGNILRIEVKEAKPVFGIFYKGTTYLIGSNGYVLTRAQGKSNIHPIYYYNGKTSPFTSKGEFIRIKNIIKLEIELIKDKLTNLETLGEKPEIILTDIGITLVFRKSKVIVYLDSSSEAWKNFTKLKKEMGKLPAGIYDLRYNGMVIRGRRENA